MHGRDEDMNSLFEVARDCLDACDADDKLARTAAATACWQAGELEFLPGDGPEIIDIPGRPVKPCLVHPSQVVARKLSTTTGRAAFLHALAHIEFNAINLAWDAVYRYRDLPLPYYADWVRIAAEEARHFAMLRERLREFGSDYGDFPAHDGLWDMARRTAHDVLLRMALVPRVLEARGLDVTPAMITRLQQAGDSESAAVLEKILAEEVGHVQAGTRWFRYLCKQRGMEPNRAFQDILHEFLPGRVRKPFNLEARQRAGFHAEEMTYLEKLAEEVM